MDYRTHLQNAIDSVLEARKQLDIGGVACDTCGKEHKNDLGAWNAYNQLGGVLTKLTKLRENRSPDASRRHEIRIRRS